MREFRLIIPDNIRPFCILPRTPEMNPIEQLWPEVRKDFKNRLFKSIDKVVDQLSQTLNGVDNNSVKSITGRDWIVSMF